MSTQTTTFRSLPVRRDPERGHRIRVRAAWILALLILSAIAIYGADYYALALADRPFSPKHELLKPSGAIGVKLGIAGVGLFLIIFLYALRKKVPWLARQGTSRHWMDFHAVAGVSAPILIAFHASFKFHGIAGMAFWIMLAVALSGLIGRYLYTQIPRSLKDAELSLSELYDVEGELASELSGQTTLDEDDLARILYVPAKERIQKMPAVQALVVMAMLDIARPFRVAALRRHVAGWAGSLRSLGGLLATGNGELEQIIDAARRKSTLSKKIVFLSRTQQVFHLWHVIHRPFSYSFAVLAVLHIVVVMGLGFAWGR